MNGKPDGRWVTETLYEGDGFTCAFRADKVLYEENTAEQHLVIFENGLFGRMMALDGITQVTERDEFIYHEMMTHVPILAHGRCVCADHRRRRRRYPARGCPHKAVEKLPWSRSTRP